MADVGSPCCIFAEVAEHSKIALTGECADEILAAIPWFHKEEALNTQAFPWSFDMKVRQTLLSEDVIQGLPMEEYARAAYDRTVLETPALEGETGVEKRRREMAYLNLRWFMATLMDRMDRTSSSVGLDARVPFADYRIIEYIWNVPWAMKCRGGSERTAAPCRRGKSAGRGTVEEKKPLSQNLSSPV